MPQFNATVVNVHLRDYAARGRRLRPELSGTPLAEWMANLDRLNVDNAWRYVALLEMVTASRAAD